MKTGLKMKYIYHYASPVGGITLASDGESLTGLWFDGQKYFCASLSGERQEKELPIFEQTSRWLDIYFSGKRPDFTPPIDLNGTDFRRTVWEILLTIPYGQTMTYGEIAEKIAAGRGLSHMSAQAVGGAVGHNPISLIIPCHRVVGSDGSLTGYAGGIDKKLRLLSMEGVDVSGFFVPIKKKVSGNKKHAVLLTAFRGTSSEKLVRRFDAAYHKLIVENDKEKSVEQLIDAVSSNGYDYVISFGQKPVIMDKIYIELMGKMDGVSYKTNFDTDGFKEALGRSGFSVHISGNAGTSYCNNIYFHGLKFISDSSCKTKMLFIHVPFEKNISDFNGFSDRLIEALENFLKKS